MTPFTPESTRLDLIALRVAHGAEMPRGFSPAQSDTE
jgi:hypothetical protein